MNDSPQDESWLRPDLAERLLDGEPIAPEGAPGTDADPRIAALARLLAAADNTPPGRAADEQAVLRAFAEEFAAAPAPRHRLRRAVPGSRTAKVLIGGAAAVFALGGVAIAAQRGALPHPFGSGGGAPASATATAPRTPSGVPGTRDTSPPGPGTTTDAAHTAPPPSVLPPPTPPAHTTGPPAVPGLKGLCQSYANAAAHRHALDAPSQARLEKAAGGPEKVAAYCARLTGTPAAHGRPTTAATGKPTAGSTGKPTVTTGASGSTETSGTNRGRAKKSPPSS